MLRRLLFLIFFCLGGFLFYIPKWILMGTKGSRERREILRELKTANAPPPPRLTKPYQQTATSRWMTAVGDWVDRRVRPWRSA